MRYEQIKPQLDEEILDEVKMSPSALQKFARSPEAEGMLMGVEFEMCVPNVSAGDDEPQWEYDYDQNERARDIDGIVSFFRDGEFSNLGPRAADRLNDDLQQQFWDWQSQKIYDDAHENTYEINRPTTKRTLMHVVRLSILKLKNYWKKPLMILSPSTVVVNGNLHLTKQLKKCKMKCAKMVTTTKKRG